MSDAERIQKLQDEIFKTQAQYQRELERLEKENKLLKQRLLLSDKGEQKRLKKLKVCNKGPFLYEFGFLALLD